LLFALGGIGFLIHLDRSITTTFEGRRWSIPAQVYAQPVELFAGAKLNRQDLVAELQRLGYEDNKDLAHPGMYVVSDETLHIYLRAFRFIESSRPAQTIQVKFARNQISRISNGQQEIALIRLDPATIGSFFESHGEDRIILTPQEVPTLLALGLKAVEDRNFDHHAGFSIRGILRALVVNLRAGERQQGGSTLTQQLVKSYFLDNRRTIERKLREVGMAIILDARFSKEDLLTAYVNEIFLGQNGNRAIHGFGLGAQFYFNKPLQELAPAEIATLLAVIRGPSYYNPFRHPERAKARRDRILNVLHTDGLITHPQLTVALNSSIGVAANPSSGGAYYPAFMDQVRAELRAQYDAKDLSSAGLRIFTTIKLQAQENAQQAVSQTLNQIEKERGIERGALQAAVLMTDSQTGEIHALVGGRKGRVDGFNRALNAKRPVGSLIKPVVYLTALESGKHLASTVTDEAIIWPIDGSDPWRPKNFNGQTYGPLPLVRALAESLNLATVNLGREMGLEHIANRFTTLSGHAPRNRYPSFLLGAEPLAPIEMLELYSNFASGGFRTPAKSVIAVLDDQGQPLTHHPFSPEPTIDYEHAWALNRALEIAMAKGTGRTSPYARSGVAGKTGTSNDNRDSWFAGFDNSHLTVVWVGRDDNKITGLTGASGALRLWNELVPGIGIDPLIHPPADDLVEIEFATGLRAHAQCADVVRVPVPNPADLQIKPGCGFEDSLGKRLRRWFRE